VLFFLFLLFLSASIGNYNELNGRYTHENITGFRTTVLWKEKKIEQTCVFGCHKILALNPTSHQLRAAASKLQQPQTSGARLWAFRVRVLGGEHHNQNFDYASSLKAMV
jgi:hypothetical protein